MGYQMAIWLNQMSKTITHEGETETYYVHGSGLMGVPHERLNEVSRLRAEFHADEARRAMMMARARIRG